MAVGAMDEAPCLVRRLKLLSLVLALEEETSLNMDGYATQYNRYLKQDHTL